MAVAARIALASNFPANGTHAFAPGQMRPRPIQTCGSPRFVSRSHVTRMFVCFVPKCLVVAVEVGERVARGRRAGASAGLLHLAPSIRSGSRCAEDVLCQQFLKGRLRHEFQFGRGSKPMVPFWDRRPTQFNLF